MLHKWWYGMIRWDVACSAIWFWWILHITNFLAFFFPSIFFNCSYPSSYPYPFPILILSYPLSSVFSPHPVERFTPSTVRYLHCGHKPVKILWRCSDTAWPIRLLAVRRHPQPAVQREEARVPPRGDQNDTSQEVRNLISIFCFPLHHSLYHLFLCFALIYHHPLPSLKSTCLHVRTSYSTWKELLLTVFTFLHFSLHSLMRVQRGDQEPLHDVHVQLLVHRALPHLRWERSAS